MRGASDSLVFCVDSSSSMKARMGMGTRLVAVQEALRSSIRSLARSWPGCHVGILAFNASCTEVCTPVQVGPHSAELLSAIDSLRPGGSTRFDPALRQAMKTFGLLPESGGFRSGGLMWALRRAFGGLEQWTGFRLPSRGGSARGRRMLIFLSDGHDAGGDPVPAAGELKSCGVEIHTVGVGRTPADVAEDLLIRMASIDECGRPCYRFIKDAKVLDNHFVKTSSRLVLRA